MKILISAYACDPYRGSEPGVGWTAVCRIARMHEVWVLTDIHNRAGWERGRQEGIVPANVRVRFIRDMTSCSSNRLIAHIQSWLGYISFNRQVLWEALAWHREIGFDLCHQVTIAAWRVPSPLWQLPVPFVWGPIGGTGYMPGKFRSILSPSSRLFELLRDLSTWWTSRGDAFLNCMRETAVVIAANEETEFFLRRFRESKPLLRLPIVSLPPETVTKFKRTGPLRPVDGKLKLFAGGNLIGTKGVSIALRALKVLSERGVTFHYTVAGGGPDLPAAKALCSKLGLDDHVEFHTGFHGADYIEALHGADAYFLPSFRESTPVTLIEAMLAGCYAVVADTSAQGEIVRLAGGHAVPLDSVDGLINGLADALQWCSANRAKMQSLAGHAGEKIVDHFSSSHYDKQLREAYRIAMHGANGRPLY